MEGLDPTCEEDEACSRDFLSEMWSGGLGDGEAVG